mgnify:FL=1
MAKKKNKFYAYWMSNRQGIVSSWPECESIVKGAKARYRGFPTRDQAQKWLDGGANYEVGKKAARKKTLAAELPKDGVYFDAGTGRGYTEARVTDIDGTPLTFMALAEDEVTKEGNLKLEGKTNNYGELTACSLAIKIAMMTDKKTVLGDSKLVIEYWSLGKIRKETAAGDAELLKLVRKVQMLRRQFEAKGGRLVHISGDVNPADLGFHK